jgi:lipopolysaccharide export system permease protein
MRLLDRYLLRELLVPLGYCLGGFLIFYVAFDLIFQISRFQEGHLLFADVVKYYVVTLPELLVGQVIPVSLLLAVLYALTNHSRYNELTAMRAAGVSFGRLSLPYLATGVVLGIVVFAINELWVPQSAEAAHDILQARQVAPTERVWLSNLDLHNEAQGRDWHIGRFNRVTSEMIDPVVITRLADGSRRDIYAKKGVYTNGAWVFLDAEVWNRPAQQTGQPEPVAQPTNYNRFVVHFPETPALIKSELKVSALSLADAARRGELSIREILNYKRLHPRLSPEGRAKLGTQLQGRIAVPFTCLAVVLIALPFGARSGRRNVFVGVAGSIFICFSYFIVQRISSGMGVAGYLWPFVAAWLPNFLFGLTGLALLWKAR